YTGPIYKVKKAVESAGRNAHSPKTLEESREIAEKIVNGGGLVCLTTNMLPLKLLGMFSDENYVPHESFEDRLKRREPSLGQLEEYVIRKEEEGILLPRDTEDQIQFPRRVVLTREQEAELFLQYNYARYKYQKALETLARKYKNEGQIEETLSLKRDADRIESILFNQNFPLAVSMSGKNKIQTLDHEDLISEASEALLRAIKQFDISRGYKFSTYACSTIIKQFSRAREVIFRDSSRYSNITDLDPKNQDFNIDNQGRERETKTSIEEVRYAIQHAGLNEREKIIIQKMFLLEQPQTLDQVGRDISVSKERTRQLKKMALAKIRHALERQTLTSKVRTA
ncbi:MAG: sigma-70 family RNA polymerase sigma factor, partial [archaeon]